MRQDSIPYGRQHPLRRNRQDCGSHFCLPNETVVFAESIRLRQTECKKKGRKPPPRRCGVPGYEILEYSYLVADTRECNGPSSSPGNYPILTGRADPVLSHALICVSRTEAREAVDESKTPDSPAPEARKRLAQSEASECEAVRLCRLQN